MATRKQRANSPEFPILEANALYAGQIRGDGNCLFNALSDQLYGDQDMHEVLRATTIEHMRDNADFYRQYMTVNNVRRNPKRKTAAAASARIDTTYYTEEQLQRQFEDHVEKMGQPGEWADNMEVSAFASALNVHVRLWQADYTYLFSPRTYYVSDNDTAAEDGRQTLHIAYHTWEHYSSVRNIAGPHSGPPEVNVVPKMVSKKRPSPSVDGDDDDQHRRARKRRSPLPLFDSDSTPEGTESSSDESNGPMLSQQSVDIPPPPQAAKPQKLTIKLRGLRTTDAGSSPASSRTSSPARGPTPTLKIKVSTVPKKAPSEPTAAPLAKNTSPTKIPAPEMTTPTKVSALETTAPTKVLATETTTPTKVLAAETTTPAKVLAPETTTPTKVLAPEMTTPTKVLAPETTPPVTAL